MKFMKSLCAFLVGFESYLIFSYVQSFPGVRNWFDAALRMELPRPYVYRVLVPIISEYLHVSFLPIAVFFSVGFFFACSYFYKSIGVKKYDLMAFTACQAMFLLTFYQLKFYDYATAFFFALMLGLLVNNKHGVFLAVFPLATLNRETTFLIIIFYAVYFFGKFSKISRKKYVANLVIMSVFFVSIKLITQITFASRAGSVVVLSPLKMAGAHVHYWLATVVMLSLFVLVFVNSISASKPILVGVFTVFVIQILLYFMAGEPFEVRVFAESLVLVIPCLALPMRLRQSLSTRYLKESYGSLMTTHFS